MLNRLENRERCFCGRGLTVRRTVLIALGLIVVAVAGLIWSDTSPINAVEQRDQSNPSAVPLPVAPGFNKPQTALPADANIPTAAAATMNSIALPPVNMPLAAIYDALVQRALAGDARAACRLGVELQQCKMLSSLRGQLRMQELIQKPQSFPPGTTVQKEAELRLQREQQSEGRESVIAPTRKRIQRIERICGTHERDAELEYPKWLLRAALAGHNASKSSYLSDQSYLPRAAVERPELVQLYVKHASEFLREGIQSGNRGALQMSAEVFAAPENPEADRMQSNWLRFTFPPDRILARTYRYAYVRENYALMQDRINTMPAGQRAEQQRFLAMNSLEGLSEQLGFYDHGLTPSELRASDLQVDALLLQRAARQRDRLTKISPATMQQIAALQRNPVAADSSYAIQCELAADLP